jgi:hypothetical protein
LNVEHGDISVSNLMFDPETKRGILNDFDLSIITAPDASYSPNRGRTGTMPFISTEQLIDGWTGNIKREYRHELESFCWVLYWICRCFSDQKETIPPNCQRWLTNDPHNCLANRTSDVLFWSGIPLPSPDYERFMRLSRKMCVFWVNLYTRDNKHDNLHLLDEVEARHAIQKIIHESGVQLPPGLEMSFW